MGETFYPTTSIAILSEIGSLAESLLCGSEVVASV